MKDFFSKNTLDPTKSPTHINLIATDYDPNKRDGSIAVFELK